VFMERRRTRCLNAGTDQAKQQRWCEF
jgi:hypothetical protein